VEEVHKEGEGLAGIGAGAATCPLPLIVGVAASAIASSPPPAAPHGKCTKFAPTKKILAPSSGAACWYAAAPWALCSKLLPQLRKK
jgi:hypothetical protein